MKHITIFILLISCSFSLSFGQSKQFNREEWEEISRDIQFGEHEGKRSEASEVGTGKRQKLSKNDLESIAPSSDSVSLFNGQVIQIILIGILVAIIVFIILKISGYNIGNPKVKANSITIENLEENLMESDLEKWLRKAQEDNDYKMVIRIYYLMIIKELALKKLIYWKKEKTNLEYVMEMRKHSSSSLFEKVTLVFQVVYYGDKTFAVDKLLEFSNELEKFYQQSKSFTNE